LTARRLYQELKRPVSQSRSCNHPHPLPFPPTPKF
jgi:hypothetical protein